MGKTKTFIVEGQTEDQTSGKDAYAAKMAKKAAMKAQIEAEQVKSAPEEKSDKNKQKAKKEDKDQVKGVGLKGGERIKVVGGDLPEETTESPVSEAPSKQKKLKVRGKSYKNAYGKVNKEKTYKLPEALKILREVSYAKFDPTVELHIGTKSNPINVNTTLPHSSGKQKVVELATEKTLEKLKSGKIDFDVLLATPDMMPKLVPFARVLGPKGLMPNPKNGTLVKSTKEADKFSGSTLNLKTQKDSNTIHTAIGKLSLKDSELTDNAKAIFDAIGDKQIVKVFLKSTMSPSIKVAI